MSHLPFFQFYPADWMQDTRVLSLHARGLWIDLLCHLWTAQERGKICLPIDAFENLTGMLEMEFMSILSEIEECNVANVKIDHVKRFVTVVSRRMVREETVRKQTLERVRRHRNAPVTQMKRVRDQKSEVRSHISEEEKNLPPLPAWLPLKAWEEYKEHRKNRRAKLTSLAARKCIAKLDELRAGGHDPAAVIDQSIQQGWTGLFPTKGPVVVSRPIPVKPQPKTNGQAEATKEERRVNLLKVQDLIKSIG